MKAFVVIILASITDLSQQAGWSYDLNDWQQLRNVAKKKLNEAQWPGLCQIGRQQSPINIMTRDAVIDKHYAHIRGPLEFTGYNDISVTGVNNGHALQWNAVPSDDPLPTLSGGPLRGKYTFMQFHLHWLSEHAIDGMKYPMEIHMVHSKVGLTVEQALAQPDGIAVVGVFALVSHGSESDRALEEIMPTVPYLSDSSQNITRAFSIDATRLMSSNPQSYYTYHGSLTTPLCEEVVTWIVMDTPILISDDQYKQFSKVDVGGFYNYRSLQPTNRVVYRSVASCSTILVPGLFGSLISILSCLYTTVGAGLSKSICAITNVKRKIFGDQIRQCVRIN